MLPLIGITAGEWVNAARPWEPVRYGQSASYTLAVAAAGGLPVMLPPLTEIDALPQLIGQLDGLVLSGGEDIDPARYGAEPSPQLGRVSELRDRQEFELLRLAREARLPTLAICRGLQLVNVSCGGTLYQDLPTELAGEVLHGDGTYGENGHLVAHDLRLDPASQLAAIIGGEPVASNTFHHQGIKELGAGLRATAWTSDGLIEGIESIGPDFLIGVQCHPESLALSQPRWLQLFQALVGQARGLRAVA